MNLDFQESLIRAVRLERLNGVNGLNDYLNAINLKQGPSSTSGPLEKGSVNNEEAHD